MSVVQIRIVSCCALGFIAGLGLLPCVDTSAQFTRFPPSVLYVSSGGAARFVWDYNVDNRVQEFSIESPVWYFYDKSSNVYITIGVDDRFTNNWDFVINRATCPPRLLNPDRVSRELPATLVISAVTTADNGKYRCSLMLKSGNNVKSQVQLVVTVTPAFLPSYPNKIYHIIEGQDLKINCTGIGPPAPNITWVNITDGKLYSKTQGSGSAVLSIDNIQRHHAGVYECQAKNNPNENAATTRTAVTVYYKPNIAKELSTNNYNSWNGRQVTLTCIADGLPTPQITWYKPSGQQITTGVTTITNGSHQTITTEDRSNYGSYKCLAVNVAGRDEHVINVTQLFPPGAPNVKIFEEEIQASSVTVRWTKPGYDGGSRVIDYKVQVNTNPSQEKSTSYTHVSFSGLTKNTHYRIKVFARNDIGYGNPFQVMLTSKQQGQPATPDLIVILLNNTESKLSVVIKWTKPDDNGGSITRYTIYMKDVDNQYDWIYVENVTNPSQLEFTMENNIFYGKTYIFVVTAWNKFGQSYRDVQRAKTISTIRYKSIRQTVDKTLDGHKDDTLQYSSTVFGILVSLLVLSLGIIVLLVVILWRKIKQLSEIKELTNKTRKPAQKTDENVIEMGDKTPVPQPIPEYETVQPLGDNASAQATPCPSYDDTSKYQGLHLQAHSSVQEGKGPMYESLRGKSKGSTTGHHDNEQHPYESLNLGNKSSHYQSLQINDSESAI